MQYIASQKQQIRFRRWSRKSYAIFCSLGKHVSIGNLTKSIIDASLPKQKSVNYFIKSNTQEKNSLDEESLDSHPEYISFIVLPELILLAINSKIQDEYYKSTQIIRVKKSRISVLLYIYPASFFSSKNTDYVRQN